MQVKEYKTEIVVRPFPLKKMIFKSSVTIFVSFSTEIHTGITQIAESEHVFVSKC